MEDTLASGHCDECGFRYDGVDRTSVPGTLRHACPGYLDLLSGTPGDVLRARPRPATWSALEYACHYRDVLRTQRDRVTLALGGGHPVYESMRRDERVVEDHYAAQDPATVGRELAGATEALAALLDGLDDRGWARTGTYLWPVRAERTVEWIGRHTVHEGVHHLLDARRSIEAVRRRHGRPPPGRRPPGQAGGR